MAKYIVLDSKFNPMSFEDRIAPYKDYYANAQTLLLAVADLETKAATLKQISDTHPEWLQEYNNYMDMLTNVRDTMYNYGVDGNLVKDVLKANKAFTEMSSMATADGQKRALTEGLNKLIQQDATAFTSIEGEEPTAYDLRKNPYADLYKTMSGAQLQSNVESKMKHYAELMSYPDFYNTEAGILTEEVSGYTPEEMSTQIALIELLLSDPTFTNKTSKELQSTLLQYKNYGLNTDLLNFVWSELESSGVNGNDWSRDAKRKAIHYITNGLWAGVGKNTWDLQKGFSSDSSGGGGGLVLQYTNNPSVTYMGSNLAESDNSSFVPDKLDLNNSDAYNLRYLANITDENNNIELPDGTSVNIIEALLLLNNTEDVESYLNDTYYKNKESMRSREYSEFYNLSLSFTNINIRPSMGYTEEKIKQKIKDAFKLDNVENIPNDLLYDIDSAKPELFLKAYKLLLMYIPDESLKKGDLALKKDLEKSNKIQAAGIIDFYNLADYLPEKTLENISKYGVRTTYAMDPQNHAVKVNWLLVTDPKGSNTAIAGNLKTAIGNGKGIIFNTEDGLNIEDTKGESLGSLKDDMQFDDNGNPKAFRVYLNPAILHYDDYAYNDLIKNKYILEYTSKKGDVKKVLISGEYLGLDYENLMNEKLFEYSQSDPSTLKTPFRGYDPTRLYTDASVTYVRNPDKS